VAAKSAAESALGEIVPAIESITGARPVRDVQQRFSKYLDLLTAWNRTHHLTGYRTARDIVRGLFVDSLLFLPMIPPRPLRVVDIGAGPGIPGIPLRIVEPGISLTLVESRRKPVSFLATLKRELDLADVRIVHGRAESGPDEPDGLYDCALIRAVRLDETLLAAALSYLRPGGLLVCGAAPHLAVSAPHDSRIREVEYPELGYHRTFVVVSR